MQQYKHLRIIKPIKTGRVIRETTLSQNLKLWHIQMLNFLNFEPRSVDYETSDEI